MNIVRNGHFRGVTLVELLVSIAITISMLLMTSVIFKSSTEASGKAMARNGIMNQLRAITRQLDQDITGLRPDMPLAIIFEGYTETNFPNQGLGDPDNWDREIRYDRLWCFANGDYQTQDYSSTTSVSGNVAHIFYGQSDDWFEPTEEASPVKRRILTRREKFITADGSLNWFNIYPSLPLPLSSIGKESEIDYMPVTNAGLNVWKNIQFDVGGGDIRNTFFRNDLDVTFSVIRRSGMVFGGLKDYVEGDEGFQRLYMSNDVTDFRIEVWFPGSVEWFPNATDLDEIDVTAGMLLPNRNTDIAYAFYWNAQDDGGSNVNNVIDNIDWRSEVDINAMGTAAPLLGWTNSWPEALRFSFTLYDRNRRHFPEGLRFSYILKVPKRI